MTALEIIRAAIPDASPEIAEHVLWGRTPFPCGRVEPKDLYRAASGFRRATDNKLQLCDCCHNLASPQDSFLCNGCRTGLAAAREEIGS